MTRSLCSILCVVYSALLLTIHMQGNRNEVFLVSNEIRTTNKESLFSYTLSLYHPISWVTS